MRFSSASYCAFVNVPALERPLSHPASASAAEAFAQAHEKVVRSDEAAVTAAKAGDRAKLRAAIARVNQANRATTPPAKQVGATDCYPG